MKIVFILLVIVFASAVFSDDSDIPEEHQKAWKRFKIRHNRVFKNATREAIRMKKFSDRLKKIEAFNSDNSGGHQIALNKFADIPKAEFNKGHKGYIAPVEDPEEESPRVRREITRSTRTPSTTKATTTTTPAPVPSSFDWRTVGAISSVKDQGSCGSCWAFATSGALEAQTFIRKNRTVDLSQQNLVDCVLNNGCDGGSNKGAYNYVQVNGGINSAQSYPYEGVDGVCRFNINNIAGTGKGYIQSKPGDEEALKRSVYLNGPHSVAIDANHDSFQLYASGVYYEPNCSSTVLDHAVLLVGYGTNKTTNEDYWIVKNSWGVDWGENGYFYLARNKNNHCGITQYATCPLV